MISTNLERGVMMNKTLIFVCWVLLIVSLSSAAVFAQDPVKWSAPADQYPQQWSPAPAPPVYDPYGYSQYAYGAYGGGYGQNQGHSYGYGMPNQNYGAGYYSGNPYYYGR